MDGLLLAEPPADGPCGQPLSAAAVRDAAERASRRVAPLWPLKHFVAVNPFLGLADRPFAEAAHRLARSAGARLTMPRDFYARAIAEGRIAEADLAATGDPAALAAAAAAAAAPPVPLPTLADLAAAATGKDWPRFVTGRIAAWAAAQFDEGQAAWRPPANADLSPYAAWRRQALLDRTPEIMGLGGFRALVATLPETAEAMLLEGARRLALPPAALEERFHRLLASIGGWAAFARYGTWQAELRDGRDATPLDLLAVRLAWEVALLEGFELAEAWREALDRDAPSDEAERAVDAALQTAYERGWQGDFLAKLGDARPAAAVGRPSVQAAFCIDVRSEVFRRALERAAPGVETIGFAGFFGVPIEYVPFGQERGGAHCPVLLKPAFTVREGVRTASAAAEADILRARQMRQRSSKAWKAFKMATVSCFAFVETMGWTYAGKLVGDALGLTRPVPHPRGDGIDAAVRPRLAPVLEPAETCGRRTGLSLAERTDTAEAVLTAMSLRRDFARVLLLVGHGATTVNNPHATGLDCGACGGHTGEANARVAAAILNDPCVRAGLEARGFDIPSDTLVLAAQHDTTTDGVRIFDRDAVPESHAGDLARLEIWLAEAGESARAERAPRLGIAAGRRTDRAVMERSRDWSQVRPEWGLAGCAAFVAAPRARTEGLDLAGRVFLHSYDWRQDEGFAVLELLLTAPLVVASWISLQYYGSTVDNAAFGCGDKVLHNVVGTLGVLEGNGGDLRSGLPWQSLHDGERLVHEPLRLTAVIEAPTEAIDSVLAKHPEVRLLLDNGWLHLFALEGERIPTFRRYGGGLRWLPVAAD